MRLMKYISGGIWALFLCLLVTPVLAQDAGRSPAAAFDPVNNRYLMVWHDAEGSGTAIKGKFVNRDGSDAGSVEVLSPPRPTQGCFYGNFDSDNGDITTPSDCGLNVNPSVAYNNGQFLIVWEVQGTASAPASSPENEYVNIFARIVNADDLSPLSGWEEGILISKVFIAANNSNACGNGKFACNDGEIQAWSQSKNAHVAPRINGGGFVVTWETNRDFIGCANRDRRAGWSIYGRFIDQSFSATSATNPPMFAVFQDDSTVEDLCAPIENVDNGTHPRIAYNESTNDFVIVYEFGRANGGRTSIGAKSVTINSSGAGQTGSGSMMGGIVASLGSGSLSNPDIVSHQGDYVLFVDDGSNIRAKKFASSNISDGNPAVIDLGGGTQTEPRGASNLGPGGQGPTTGMAPTRLAVAYREGEDVLVALLNNNLAVQGDLVNISGGAASNNRNANLSSDTEDFLGVWQGNDGAEKVYAATIDTDNTVPVGDPPTAPGLLTPNDGVIFAPIRAYLSWSPSTDPDGDDANITYNVYFGETTLPGSPQATGLTDTNFVIGPETQTMTGVTLEANKVYKWAIEAVDQDTDRTLSMERTLSTDNSVVGWWRFDEDPAGVICPGGAAGQTVCDYSSFQNHAEPFGSPLWIAPGMPSILGGALDFDGTDDYLVVNNHNSLNPDSLTVISVFQTNGNVGQQHIVDKREPSFTLAGYFQRISGGSYPIGTSWSVTDSSGTEYNINTVGNINDMTRYQLTTTFDIGTGDAKIFVDGTLANSINHGVLDRSSKTTVDLVLGDASVSPQPNDTLNAEGIYEEIIIINRSLDSTEVLSNFNSIN